jgi:hypothetical protein
MTNLRKLAEGNDCKLRLPGVCNGKSETVVLCHIKRGWCGSIKPPDIVAVHGCSDCHDVVDRRRGNPWSEEELDAMILRALCEQLVWYVKQEIVRW